MPDYGGAEYSYDDSYSYEAGGTMYEESVRGPESAADIGGPDIRSARKLIETVTLEVETKDQPCS